MEREYKTSEKQRAAMYRYQHSPKGRAKLESYWKSERFKEVQRRYRQSPKGRARLKAKNYYRKPFYWRKTGGEYIRRLRISLDIQIIAERDGDSVHAYCPQLKGLHTEGKSIINAVANAKLAAEAYIKSLIKHGEPIPTASHNQSSEKEG